MKAMQVGNLSVLEAVEYKKPFLGRIFGAFTWLMVVRIKKLNLMLNGKTMCSFRCLIIPHFLEVGDSGER